MSTYRARFEMERPQRADGLTEIEREFERQMLYMDAPVKCGAQTTKLGQGRWALDLVFSFFGDPADVEEAGLSTARSLPRLTWIGAN